jgi:hypothetical protein
MGTTIWSAPSFQRKKPSACIEPGVGGAGGNGRPETGFDWHYCFGLKGFTSPQSADSHLPMMVIF